VSITRRNILLAAGAGAVGLGTGQWAGTAGASLAAARRPFTPYTAHSYFRRPVTGHRVDESRTRAFHHFMRTFHRQQGVRHPIIAGVGGSAWGTAFATGSHHDPVWKLTGSLSPHCAVLRTRGFHAPHWLGSMLTGTADSPFCVVDRASGFTVYGGGAVMSGHRLIHVRSAGVTYHSSNGLTGTNPRSDNRRNFTGRGRISDAMVIRRDLVDYGIAHRTGLGHVLQLFMTETRSADGYCNPMVGCEAGQNGFGAEGERIAIGRHVDLRKRGLSPAGLVVARTLQEHGCYIGDNAGGPSALKAEQENRGRPVWHGMLRKDSLRGIGWDDFVVLRHHPHH
jgi:hypothetical protein